MKTPMEVHQRVIDLFAGPGGWSEGLKALGYSEVGIEWDDAACATARAAGHIRHQADVAELDAADWGPCDGLIASPPCQAWSMAGKGGGRRDVEHVISCALEIAAGNDTRAEHAAKCEDARSMLVVEPLRWIEALTPTWVALEQVPPVLELWTLFAQILERWGYSTWAGVLEAERYGVPQTRERAILMAHRERTVQPPQATHQRYVPGEARRHDVTMLGEVLPWVSMADALGWGMTARPCVTVAAGSGRQGGPSPLDGGSGARATVRTAQELGAWLVPDDEVLAGGDALQRGVSAADGDNGAVIGADDGDKDGHAVDGEGELIAHPRHKDMPAQDVKPEWATSRPATTVVGSFRPDVIAGPGFRHAGDGPRQDAPGSVKVSVQEAAILQSFRPDYPWQGSRSKQFEQVGNAVPPLLARAVLAELVEPIPMEAAA